MRFPTNPQPRRSLKAAIALSVVLMASQSAIARASSSTPQAEQALSETPGNVLTAPTTPVAPAPAASVTRPVVQESVVRLVLKRSKRRVYVYKDDKVVSSYPVAVGKRGWETPVGKFKVLNMEKNPTFKSFKSGAIIPPGPNNPLGVRWIGFWTDGKTQIGFHGTNQPYLIGRAVSHGCVRMRNRDVVRLYAQVKPGTSVQVVP